MKEQKQPTINQHYIPQFYLHQFSYKNKKGKDVLDVLDIDTNNILKNQRIDKIAFEKYFYDIDLEKYLKDVSKIRKIIIQLFLKLIYGFKFNIKEFKNLNTIENTLAKIEGTVAPIFRKLIRNVESYTTWERENCYIISKKEKDIISNYLAIQFLRTPKIRQIYQEVNTIVIAKLIQEFHYRNTGEILDLNDLIEEKNEEDIKNQHLNTLFSKFSNETSDIFKNHTWVFFENTTNVDFITSDSPINTKATKDETIKSYGGINSEGVIIIFPISKKLILFMYQDELNMHNSERKLLICDNPEIVKSCNLLTFFNCHRFLYGQEKEISEFKEYVNLHKKSKDPNMILANSMFPNN